MLLLELVLQREKTECGECKLQVRFIAEHFKLLMNDSNETLQQTGIKIFQIGLRQQLGIVVGNTLPHSGTLHRESIEIEVKCIDTVTEVCFLLFCDSGLFVSDGNDLASV